MIDRARRMVEVPDLQVRATCSAGGPAYEGTFIHVVNHIALDLYESWGAHTWTISRKFPRDRAKSFSPSTSDADETSAPIQDGSTST